MIPRKPHPAIRFWDKIKITDKCWGWDGSHSLAGYGKINYMGKEIYAHRLSWEIHYGSIPEDTHVCHRCDNPGCIRPDHLFLGTHRDNMQDMASKGRSGFQKYPQFIAKGSKHRSITHPESIPRGEKHFRAKLTEQDVMYIKSIKLKTGRSKDKERTTIKDLMNQFNVSRSTINFIRNGRNWKHLL